MSIKFKGIDIEKKKNYFFNDIINRNIFYPNDIKIDEKS